jgi:hypothetical protein
MKRSTRGIFFDSLETVRMHIFLNFSLDYSADYWQNGFMANPKFVNEKSVKSKIIQALYDIK